MAYGGYLFEEMAKLYPHLTQKASIDYFSISPGWENIIRCLCQTIYSQVDRAQRDLRYLESKSLPDSALIAEQKKELANAINNLPVIIQVKEKFGTLRFHTTGASTDVLAAIQMAQSLSGCTCEECGAPGERESGEWISTLCNTHKPKDTSLTLKPMQGATSPNLFED